jgi:hypothetical protein
MASFALDLCFHEAKLPEQASKGKGGKHCAPTDTFISHP